MNKKRLFTQIAISLAIVLVFGLIIAITYSSLIKKSKLNTAIQSLKNAAIEVLLHEGIECPFEGVLVYHEIEANGTNATSDAVLYVKINQDSSALLAEGAIDLVYHDYDEACHYSLTAYAGYGLDEGEDESLHVKLKELSVTYYKLVL